MQKIDGPVREKFEEFEVGDWSQARGGFGTSSVICYMTGGCSDGCGEDSDDSTMM
jgi:hypothetical protein